jgi:hypothetical protein
VQQVSAAPQVLAAPQSFVGMQAPALPLEMTGLQEPMMGLDPMPDSLRLLVEMIAPRSSKTQLSVPVILRGSHSAKPSELAMLSPPVYERDATFSRSSSDAERFEFFDLLRKKSASTNDRYYATYRHHHMRMWLQNSSKRPQGRFSSCCTGNFFQQMPV